jgi:glycosidase
MPIHPIGEINSVNSPYSVKNYKAVSPEYGTLNDLRMLTDEAHARGMAVIMDWVANHTAWDHEWINNHGWYTTNSNGEIVHPPGTNWLDVADLNYSSFPMRHAMIEAMKYWVLEANIDGYRCDYADGVPFDFWRVAIETLRDIPGRELIMLAEGSRLDHLKADFDLIYAWDFYHRMRDVYNGQPATILFSNHLAEYTEVPAGKHRLRYTTNHDESAWEATPMVFFNGKQGALAASVAAIFMGGATLFYTGQEVGRISNVPFFSNSPINWSENPDMLSAYRDMMEVYVGEDAARKGELTDYSSTNVVSFSKILNNEELLVIVNLRNTNQQFSVPQVLQNSTWNNTLADTQLTIGATVSLSNYQYLILKRN